MDLVDFVGLTIVIFAGIPLAMVIAAIFGLIPPLR
jgi:hypothetical protein